MPASDVPETALPPEELLRSDLPLPELAEVDVVRHYTHSQQFQLQRGWRFLSARLVHDEVQPEDQRRYLPPARIFTHPSLTADRNRPGQSVLMYTLQEWLKEIAGFAAVTLQPAAGAHGEFTGVLMMRAYHKARGDAKRRQDDHPRLRAWHQPCFGRHDGLANCTSPV